MGLLKKIKSFEKAIDFGKGKYKFNKVVFNVMILLMVLLTLIVWSEYDFGDIKKPNIYLECEPPNSVCSNNFYDLCNPDSYKYVGGASVCDDIDPGIYADEFLYMGESVGHKPSWLAESVGTLFFVLIMLAFLINHFIINKKYKFKRFEVR